MAAETPLSKAKEANRAGTVPRKFATPAKDRRSGRFNALFTLKFSVSASKTLYFENPMRSGRKDCRFEVNLTKLSLEVVTYF